MNCCYCSIAKSCPTLCHPMSCSMLGFCVLHYLPEFAQIHVHWVGDAIQPSHPLLPSSPFAFSLAQNQGLLQWVFTSGGQSIGASASASVLPMNIQDWFPLRLTGLISLLSKELSRTFSSITIQRYQFFGTQPSLRPKLTSIHDYWKTITLTRQTFVSKVMPLLFNIYKISHLLYPFIC